MFMMNTLKNTSCRSVHDVSFVSLQDIALRTTTRSGISRGLAYRHLLEQLSVCLWRHNARTFLHLFSLLPGSLLWELNSV